MRLHNGNWISQQKHFNVHLKKSQGFTYFSEFENESDGHNIMK